MYNEKKTITMINQLNVVHLNNSPVLYTKLVTNPPSLVAKQQYLQISKDNEFHLIETVSIMGKTYRGVTRDNVFWFLVEDLIELNQNSKNRLALIEKLLNNIPNQYKGFVQCVDNIGTREFVLMVSILGIKDKLFS